MALDARSPAARGQAMSDQNEMPNEMLALHWRVRLDGLVKNKSLNWLPASITLDDIKTALAEVDRQAREIERLKKSLVVVGTADNVYNNDLTRAVSDLLNAMDPPELVRSSDGEWFGSVLPAVERLTEALKSRKVQ